MKFSKEELTERMHSGKLYFCDDPALAAEQLIWLDKVYDYNALKPSQQEEKKRLLKEMFAEIGEGCYLETPFYANWGGRHVHLGDGVYANFNLTLVDDCEIFIGDHVMIGPNVVLATGTHPVNPRLRYQQAQYNLPIHIEENVWIGAGSVVLPGVTIGKNCRIHRAIIDRDVTIADGFSLGIDPKADAKLIDPNNKSGPTLSHGGIIVIPKGMRLGF